MIHPPFHLEPWTKLIPLDELKTEYGRTRALRRLRSEVYSHLSDDQFSRIIQVLEYFGAPIENPVSTAISTQLHQEVTRHYHLPHRAAMDMVVWKWGEGNDLRRTRIGGRPLWPKGRRWPVGPDGEPMKLFCQFCFADSPNILPKLPGDILMILSAKGENSIFLDEQDPSGDGSYIFFSGESGYTWQAYWFSLDDTLEPVADRSVVIDQFPLHGSLFRFHDSFSKDHIVEVDRENIPLRQMPEYTDLGLYKIFPMQGTKIGGLPAYIQNTQPPEGCHFLSALWSYWLTPAFPDFPASLSGKQGDSLILGDMGHLNFFWNPSGGGAHGSIIGQLGFY